MSSNFNVSPDYDFWEKLTKAYEIRKAIYTLINEGITPEQYEKCYKDRMEKMEKVEVN